MRVVAIALVAFLLGFSSAVRADDYAFNCITDNDPGDCAIGEAQIGMDVVAGPLTGQVSFTFTNTGPDASTLARIYFDDGSLINLASIINGPGVSFAQAFPGPNDLPGGENVNPPFVTTEGFLSGAQAPPPTNGVENDPPGEFVTLVFDLDVGQSVADVIDELNNGALRAGVHVINYASGGSESLVNDPVPTSFCGDGTVSGGEACDDGNTSDGDCCSSTCQIEPASVVCRPSAGVCDAAENCDGVSGTCPVDSKSTAECRASAGVCDVAELCDGVSDACPIDGYDTGTECRAAAGACDVADSCDGSGPNCPADAKSTAECRPSAGVCDLAEFCDGVSNYCPWNARSTAVCRPSTGVCDVAESCSAVSDDCPADGYDTGTECRASVGACDAAESCDGSGPSCPVDAKSTGECRASAGVCDVAEICDGVSDACPVDGYDTGTECRASAGVCDVAESCDGSGPSCPTDVKSTAECRPSAGVCDVAESCDGVNDACPGDGYDVGTECRASAGACDVAESCDGSGPSCPADAMAPDGTSCADGDLCDGTETCQAGTCTPGAPLVCDDGAVCNGVESCNPSSGCVAGTAAPDGTSCADGDLCDGAETCQAGACTPGAPLVCDDGEVCNGAESCDPSSGCVAGTDAPDGTSCADSDLCNGDETCSAGVCGGGTPLVCADANVCTADSCDPTLGCQNPPVSDGTSCADADLCDGAETCQAGVCTPGSSPDCDDGNPCTADSCESVSGCLHTPVTDGTSCADADLCNGFESCWGGTCVSNTPLDCDDSSDCTTDSCDPLQGCQYAPISCDDGDACTADSCDEALGCQSAPISCDDGSICTTDSCDSASGCQYAPIPCDDGDICTADSCHAVLGCQSTPLSCDDGDPCTSDSCDPVSGCQNPAAPNGTSCADAEECNGAEICINGACTAGSPLGDGTPCGDGNPCNGDDTCLAAACVGGTPPPSGTPCSDGNACNGLESCWSEVCTPATPLDCDDGDDCTADSCDQLEGCANHPIPDCGVLTDAVVPLLECVADNGDGTFTAFFGYRNDNPVPVTIPVGAANFFDPPPIDAGQLELFEVGRSPFLPDVAFTVDFDGSPLVWTLQGPDGIPRSSTASASSSPCPYFDVGTQSICYRALRPRGFPKPDKVRMIPFEDPFQDKLFDVSDHKMVCTPASFVTSTSVTGPVDPEAHMGGRKLWRARTKPLQPMLDFRDPNHTGLEVTDAFGTILIDVRRDYRVLVQTSLCDPAAEICPVDAGVLDTSELDTDLAFSCYRVRVTPNTPRFEKRNFLGSDRFQTQAYRVARPRMLCAMANKDGGNPQALTDPRYQLCYRIHVAKSFCEPGSPEPFALETCKKDEDCGGLNRCITYPKPFSHRRIPNLQVNNEFGPETLKTYYEEMICLDATIAP